MTEDVEKVWHAAIRLALPPITPLPSESLIEAFAVDLQSAVYNACEAHMDHKRAPGAHSKTWWTAECTAAAHASRAAADAGQDNATQTTLRQTLKRVTKKAKREWADKAVMEGNVWNVVKWRHGRKLSTISALRDPDGDLTFEPTDMADILAQ